MTDLFSFNRISIFLELLKVIQDYHFYISILFIGLLDLGSNEIYHTI